MEHLKKESAEILKSAEEVVEEAVEEAVSPAADTEADQEWKEFIRQERERLQNREKAGENRKPGGAEESDPSFASILEKLPVEHIVETAMQFLTKAKPKSKGKSKK